MFRVSKMSTRLFEVALLYCSEYKNNSPKLINKDYLLDCILGKNETPDRPSESFDESLAKQAIIIRLIKQCYISRYFSTTK
jgi:hypothetical protein